MDVLTLYVGNDMLLEVEGLGDDATGVFVNNATVTVTLYDAAGNPVGGETWPKTMSYVASTDGIYRATLGNVLGVAVNTRYRAHVIADAGAGRKSSWDIDVVAKSRRR